MKNYIILAITLLASLLSSCEKDTFHDTGLANGVHNCSLYEYLCNDPKNYDSLLIIIRKADLIPLFEGKDQQYPEITLFAPTNLSIIQYIERTTDDDGNRLYNRIDDIPADECREILLSYIITGKHKRRDFPYEIKGSLEGGEIYTTLNNVALRVFRTQNTWNGMDDIGNDGIGIHFQQSGHITSIASGDITTDNAIVHSLSTTFQLVNPVIHQN